MGRQNVSDARNYAINAGRGNETQLTKTALNDTHKSGAFSSRTGGAYLLVTGGAAAAFSEASKASRFHLLP